MKKWSKRMLAVCTVLAMVGGFCEIQNTLNGSEAVPQVSAYGDDTPTTYPTYEPYQVKTDITMIGLFGDGIGFYFADDMMKQTGYLSGKQLGSLKFILHSKSDNLGDLTQQSIFEKIDFEKTFEVSSSNEEVATVKATPHSCKTAPKVV